MYKCISICISCMAWKGTLSHACTKIFKTAYISTVFLRLYDRLFSFQNNPNDLDPSFKMDLDLWDCLGRVKSVL